jgi:hypothetical protein
VTTEKKLRALYNNPAVVYAMRLLTDLGVTGATYDELVNYRCPCEDPWCPTNGLHADETVGPLDEYRGQ